MSFRIDTLKSLLTTASESYKDGVRISTLLDDKAQKTGGFAGLFLVVALGFLKPSEQDILIESINLSGVILLTSVVILLVLCLSFCLAAMWLRSVAPPLNLALQMALSKDLLALPDSELVDDIQTRDYHDQITTWTTILDGQAGINKVKAKRLFVAQLLFAIVVGLIAVLLIFSVIKAYNTIPVLERRGHAYLH